MDARESGLCDALLEAYRSRDDLEELLDNIDPSLDQLVSDSVDLKITVKRVVRKGRRERWLSDLEGAALGARSCGNQPQVPLGAEQFRVPRPEAIPRACQRSWLFRQAIHARSAERS